MLEIPIASMKLTNFLHIDKAIKKLDWTPKIGFEKSIEKLLYGIKIFMMENLL